MRGAVPPLPNTPSWRGANLRAREQLYIYFMANNITMDLRKIEREGVDWMRLAQNRDQWRAFVNTVRTLGFHKRQVVY
jgi:hypothetical protein